MKQTRAMLAAALNEAQAASVESEKALASLWNKLAALQMVKNDLEQCHAILDMTTKIPRFSEDTSTNYALATRVAVLINAIKESQ